MKLGIHSDTRIVSEDQEGFQKQVKVGELIYFLCYENLEDVKTNSFLLGKGHLQAVGAYVN